MEALLISNSALTWYLKNLPGVIRKEMLARILKRIESFKKEKFGEDRTKLAHKVIDDILDNLKLSDKKFKNVKCGDRCSFCCHIHVRASFSEAAYLAQEMQAGRIQYDKQAFDAQKKLIDKDYLKTRGGIPCFFLTPEGRCGVYPIRPTACRAHHSLNEPEKCNVAEHPDTAIEIWHPLRAAMVTAALQTADFQELGLTQGDLSNQSLAGQIDKYFSGNENID